VYSPRAKERPTVSVPLSWDEIREALQDGDAERLMLDMHAVLARVEDQGDLFAEVLTLVQELPSG
jgi:bifunctional non-homologous end joining protein LigD